MDKMEASPPSNPKEAIQGLLAGDFTRLDPLFLGDSPTIVDWHRSGALDSSPMAMREALTCACFNGRSIAARYFLDCGIDPSAGNATGLDALHWAASRGHVDVVRMLLDRGADTETVNSYGGTALGCAAWCFVHQPMTGQWEAIQLLMAAGADRSKVEFPTGDAKLDALLAG